MEPITGQPSEPDAKKPLDGPAPTQIVINSQDGSIMTADEAAEASNAPIASVEPQQVASEQQTSSAEVVESDAVASPIEESTTPQSDTAIVQNDEKPSTSTNNDSSVENVQSEQAGAPKAANETSTAVSDPVATESPVADNPMAIPVQAPKTKKSGGPKLVIAIALIVSLLLAGFAIFAYMSSQKSDDSKESANQSQQTQETSTQPEPVTADEIDAASSEIDAEINKTTGDSDIPSSESVNDQTLGL